MNKFVLRLSVLICLVLLLSACFGPKTPQDVTQAFWKAVLNNNAKNAVEYSTLTDPKYYDSFSKDWIGFQPSFGKVTIEERVASVVSEFAGPANSGQENRSFTTYLVLHNEEWKVDYDRTKNSIIGGALGDLFSKLNRLGDDISRQFESSADSFKLEMDRMGKELEQMSDSLGQQASKSLEKYAELLRNSIKELEESINRALKEENNNLSDEDKLVLQEIAADLDQNSENLSEPSIEAVTVGSKNIGETQQQLETMDNDSLDEYKKEWHELSKQFKEAMREMMDELSFLAKNGNTSG
jgi:division protein CdvB (Snf7/Vps24/ESCRT-III family)